MSRKIRLTLTLAPLEDDLEDFRGIGINVISMEPFLVVQEITVESDLSVDQIKAIFDAEVVDQDETVLSSVFEEIED